MGNHQIVSTAMTKKITIASAFIGSHMLYHIGFDNKERNSKIQKKEYC